MEDTAIDLREFTFQVFRANRTIPDGAKNSQRIAKFSQLLDSALVDSVQLHLEPGESFTIMPVRESRVTDKNSPLFGRNITRPGFRDSADYANYGLEGSWDTDPIRIEMGWEEDSSHFCSALTNSGAVPYNAVQKFPS